MTYDIWLYIIGHLDFWSTSYTTAAFIPQVTTFTVQKNMFCITNESVVISLRELFNPHVPLGLPHQWLVPFPEQVIIENLILNKDLIVNVVKGFGILSIINIPVNQYMERMRWKENCIPWRIRLFPLTPCKPSKNFTGIIMPQRVHRWSWSNNRETSFFTQSTLILAGPTCASGTRCTTEIYALGFIEVADSWLHENLVKYP